MINQLSRTSGEGEQAGSSANSNGHYTDVNGDKEVTALDALQVINYLIRSGRGNAAGEQVFGLQDNFASDSGDEINDEVVADLSGESNIVGMGSSDSSGGASVGLVASDSALTDDDEDDLLSLLADDVAGLWS